MGGLRTVALVGLVLLAGCAAPATPVALPTATPLMGRLTFAGSTTMQPLIEKLAEVYEQAHPQMVLEVAAGGSLVGINAVHEGSADIGMASRALTSAEQGGGIELFPIAYDALAIIVHPSNPIRGLSFEQLQGIYTGRITNWREVGGGDLPIHPVVREVSSGTRGAFDEIVLGAGQQTPGATARTTAGEVETSVARDPGAIGYVGFGNIKSDVVLLPIDGVTPTPQSVQQGTYRLKRPLILLLGPLSRPQARTFIDFVRSAEGQRLVGQDGWVPVSN